MYVCVCVCVPMSCIHFIWNVARYLYKCRYSYITQYEDLMYQSNLTAFCKTGNKSRVLIKIIFEPISILTFLKK